MDRKLWLLVICVVGLMFVAVGQKSEVKSGAVGLSRYELVSVQQEQDGKLVFVLDTQTGRVWKYQPPVTKPFLREAFVAVGFGTPAEEVPGSGLKDSASEDRH
jgi:hypothetical protein